MATKEFDLNIERVLEHWTIAHALREVIANAIDEQQLTKSGVPQIRKDELGHWRIRDQGRGLNYQHLTQNENKEKLDNPTLVIGKFGVGLKDALATFERRRIGVEIHSKHGVIRIGKARKRGFDDLTTLHAMIDPPGAPAMRGTEFILSGVKDTDVDQAKGFFLRYSGDTVLETTPIGQVLSRKRSKSAARIYVNGLLVAEEPNFLFSYNITSPTKPLLRALNRERSNVGRSAYTDRVKSILLACTTSEVAGALADDLQLFQKGRDHDELKWLDVAVHACRVLNSKENALFVTPEELQRSPTAIGNARGDGHRIVIVPDAVRTKLPGLVDLAGEPLRDLGVYMKEWDRSFKYAFVDPRELTEDERLVWEHTPRILKLGGGKPSTVKDILISETMRPDSATFGEALGVWEPVEGRIVVKRSQLASVTAYAGTLLHEVVHARGSGDDLSFEFVAGMTELLGIVARNALSRAEHSR